MAAWRSTTDRKTPRFRRRLVSVAKKVSTALSQEQEVGVKWKVNAAEPGDHLRVLVGGVVVEDDVDELTGRHRRFEGVEETDELLVPMALHAAAEDRALEHVAANGAGQEHQLAICSCSSHRTGSSEKLDVFNPYGSRPSTAALTTAGARKARLRVMRTARSLQRS